MKKPEVFVVPHVAPARSFTIDLRCGRTLRCLLGPVAFIAFVLPAAGQTQRTMTLDSDPVGGSSVFLTGSGATSEGGTGAAGYSKDDSQRVMIVRNTKPFSTVGLGAHVGLNGVGFDVATPLSGKFNLRAGGDFFSYSDTFTTDGTNVNADLHLMSAHVAFDWFPFNGRFRLSPGVTFANDNRVRADAVVPAGSTITLNGSDYTSSVTDPLHGSGSIDFRKTAPGLTVGLGNLVPRHGGHFSFPIDLGFIYVGQPRLKVNFTGSACESGEPPAIGCQPVDQYAEFQSSLTAFRNRINTDLDYANFYPILSAGVGYSF